MTLDDDYDTQIGERGVKLSGALVSLYVFAISFAQTKIAKTE